MILPVLCAILWLAVMLVLAAVCRMAAHGDRDVVVAAAATTERSTSRPSKRSPGKRPTVHRALPAIARHELRRPQHPGPPLRDLGARRG
jgi:hypothetical protein